MKNIEFKYNNQQIWFNLLWLYLSLSVASIGFFLANKFYQNFAAALFVIICMFFLIKGIKDNHLDIKVIILTPIVINLALIIMNILINDGASFFVTYDTLHNFFPKSELLIEEFESGSITFIPKNWMEKFLLFDVLNIPVIYFLGRNESIFLMQLAVYRSICMFIVYKTGLSIWNDKTIAKIASLIFVFNPLYILHSSLIYKESLVQLLFAIFYFGIIKFLSNSTKVKYLIIALIASVFCVWERIYLVLPITIGFCYCFLDLWREGKKLFIFFTTSIIFVIVLFSANLLTAPENIISYLFATRDFNSTYLDVDKGINYKFGYIFGIVKLIFSPYPNMRKLDLFSGLDSLIFWGSFFGSMLSMGALVGFIQEKINRKIAVMSFLMTISFSAFVGFIAPYGFRQRDTIATLFVLWSACSLVVLLRKKNPISKGD